MSGMNVHTGKIIISDRAHLEQSLVDILTTPKGSRVMNRDYGSRLFELIDSPITGEIEFYVATAEAIEAQEPRFKLRRVKLALAGPGHVALTLVGDYLPSRELVTVTVEVRS